MLLIRMFVPSFSYAKIDRIHFNAQLIFPPIKTFTTMKVPGILFYSNTDSISIPFYSNVPLRCLEEIKRLPCAWRKGDAA